MDIDADVFGKVTNKEIFNFIRYNLDFDQLIWEYGNKDEPAWVHVSYNKVGNRNSILRSYKVKNKITGKVKTKYMRIN